MAERELLATSANGIGVYFDPVGSHTATHFEDTPQLRDLCKEIIENTSLQDELVELETDMGRTVGETDAIVNDLGDVIVYAKRKNRDEYTPFNKSQGPKPSRFVTIALQKLPDGDYELLSAFISPGDTLAGEPSPPFPGQENETPNSKDYWSKHSLAWGTQEIQDDTLTSTCPW